MASRRWWLALPVLLLSLLAGCSGEDRPGVALLDDAAGLEALVNGRIVIDDCVKLQVDVGGLLPLVFDPRSVSWAADRDALQYDDGQIAAILEDGDIVELGGGEVPTANLAGKWRTPPTGSCVARSVWLVDAVVEGGQ